MEYYNDYLMHYGIKGMKWGVRRFQNADGSLTDAGKKRMRKQVDQVKKNLKNFEQTTAKSNATLESSKGYQLLSADANRNNKQSLSKRYKNASDSKMNTHMQLEDAAKRYMEKYLKSKVTALADINKIKDGKQFVDELLDLRPSVERISEYERQYSKGDEGNDRNREHLRKLGVNI